MTIPNFDRNTRVLLNLEGKSYRGRVTAVLHRRRRVVTDSGKRVVVPVSRLKHSPDRVLILEARLDRNLRSSRTYGPMMQQWLSAYNVEALYERVHTVDAVRRFIRREGKNIATRFLHIMGHGTDGPGVRDANLHLTFEDLNLIKHADVFEGLEGKVIIFSCCEIAANMRALQTVKDISGAAGVIGYRKEVADYYTNLAEVLLYDRLLKSNASPQKAVEIVAGLLRKAGVKAGAGVVRKPILVSV